uniref:Uncharacterized protein n=1 Tax=Anopheles epiroticus TaxID=199890 RepID=A0A182P140_9DIPT
MNISGPTKRKALQSVRQNSHPEVGDSAADDGPVNRVTNITAGCFGGMEPILLTGNHFKRSDIQQDYGVFLVQQKEALRQRGVMVVRNLEDVPGSAAQAFHTICDTEEPLVDSAIIYLALDMFKLAGVTEPSDESAAKEAERALNMLWKNSLRPQILLPLITRLTETVHWIV